MGMLEQFRKVGAFILGVIMMHLLSTSGLKKLLGGADMDKTFSTE